MPRRISFRVLFLFFNTLLITLAVIVGCGNLRTALALPKLQNGFYSRFAMHRFGTYKFEQTAFWNAVDAVQTKGYALYQTQLEFSGDTRGVYFYGSMQPPPLLHGRFFSQEEQRTHARVALIGRSYQDQVFTQGNTPYIEILGEPFVVIGTLGTEKPSLLDDMKWIPLDTSMQLAGIHSLYRIDAVNRRSLREITAAIDVVFKAPKQAAIDKAVLDNEQNNALWASQMRMNNATKIYVLVSFGFLVTAAFSIVQWCDSKQLFANISNMFGFSAPQIMRTLFAMYFRIFVPAAILAYLLAAMLQHLQIIQPFTAWDVCLAISVNLFLCGFIFAQRLYVWRKKSERGEK